MSKKQRPLYVLCGVLVTSMLVFVQWYSDQFTPHAAKNIWFRNSSCFSLNGDLINNLNATEKQYSTFQPIGAEGSLSYIYTAYIDDRQGMLDVHANSTHPVIKLFAFIHRKHHLQSKETVTRWSCLLWNKKLELVDQTPVLSCYDLNLSYKSFSTRVAPVMMSCSLPKANDGSSNDVKYISIVTTSECQVPRNLLPVVDLPAVRRSVSDGSIRNYAEFVICPRPVRYGDVLNSVDELVEFMEVNQMFGAKLLHLYIESTATDDKKLWDCIEQYERLGVIETTPWSLPHDIYTYVPQYGQFFTETECLYRMLYRSTYVIHQDLDEFIVPTNVTTWREMIEAINMKEKKRLNEKKFLFWKYASADSVPSVVDISTRIASYNFRNRFFPKDWAIVGALDETLERQVDEIGRVYERFRTLGKVLGEKRLFPWKDRSKTFAKPEYCVMQDVHEILDEAKIRTNPELINSFVDEADGSMFHYRKNFGNSMKWKEPSVYSRMRDFTLEIVRRLQIGLKMCKADSKH